MSYETAFIVFMLGVCLLFTYMAFNLGKEHKVLSILFFLLTFVVLIIASAIVRDIFILQYL